MKRTLSLILSLLMVLSLFTGLSVSAQSVGDDAMTRVSDDPDAGLADTGADTELSETGEEPEFETRDIGTIKEFETAIEEEGNIILNIVADLECDIYLSETYLDDYSIRIRQYIRLVLGKGKKIIELNGHSIYYSCDLYIIPEGQHYTSNGRSRSSLMMIGPDSELTVNGSGSITYAAKYDLVDRVYQDYPNRIERNVFYVYYGKLTINGGTIEGGSSERLWGSMSYLSKEGHTTDYVGYAYRQGGGTAVYIRYGSDVTINGGTLIGREYGAIKLGRSIEGSAESHHAYIDAPSTLTIYDGEFWGMGGGSIFCYDTLESAFDGNQITTKYFEGCMEGFEVNIYGGVYKVNKPDNPQIHYKNEYVSLVDVDFYGDPFKLGYINIPTATIDPAISRVRVQGRADLTPEELESITLEPIQKTVTIEPKSELTGEMKKYLPASDSYGTQNAGETYTWDKVTSLRFEFTHDFYYPKGLLRSYDDVNVYQTGFNTAVIRATADGDNIASLSFSNDTGRVDLNNMSGVDKEKLEVGKTYYLRLTDYEYWDNRNGGHIVNYIDDKLVKIKIVNPDYTMPSTSVSFTWSNSVDQYNKNRITLTPDVSNLDALVRSGKITRYSGTFYYTNNYNSSSSYTTVKPYTTTSFYRGISKVKYTASLYKGTTKMGSVSKELDVVCFPDISSSKTITGYDTVDVPADASDKMVVLSVASNSVTGLFWTKDGSRIGGSTMERSVDLSNIANSGHYSIGYTLNGVNYYREKGLNLKTQIASVAVTGVVEPVSGASPTFTASVPSGKGYQVQNYNYGNTKNGIYWYNMTDYHSMTESDAFEGGKRYEFGIFLEPSDKSYSFASGASGTLNGLSASTKNFSDGTVRVSRTFTCPDVLNALHVNGQPKATIVVNGSSVNASSVPPHTYVTLEESTQAEIIDSKWQIPGSQGGTFVDYTGAFTGDNPYYYPVYTIAPMDGTSFASKVHVTFDGETAVTATRNADGTITVRGPGVRPSVAIMLSNIYLQVTVPAAGSAPDYSAINNGYGCYVNAEYPGTGFRNGVYWYNDTDKKEMTPNDTFVKGKKYLVKVDVQAAPGWEFDIDKIITATVNGNKATVISPAGSISATNNFVQYTFTCENVVAVADCTVTEPVAGQKPSYTATVPAGKGYQVEEDFTDGTWVNGVLWQNVTDNKDMTENDTFEAGKQYTATVLLDAADKNRPFASSVKATMNGKNAEVISYGNSTIGVYRTFTCQTTAILGDVDFDGNIEIRDATWIQRSVADIEIPFVIKKLSADVDGDGNITVMDATYIQRWLANLKSNDHIGQPMG